MLWIWNGGKLRSGLNFSQHAEIVLYFSSRWLWFRCYHRLNGPQWIWWEWCWATKWVPNLWCEPGFRPDVQSGPSLYSRPFVGGHWEPKSLLWRYHWFGYVIDGFLVVGCAMLLVSMIRIF